MVHIIMYVIAFMVVLFCVAAELNVFMTGIIGTAVITVYYIAYYSIKCIIEGKPILKVRRSQEPESGGKEEQQPKKECRAFANCSGLEEVYLPEHMMCTGGGIFKGCDQLDKEKMEEWEKRVNVKDELPGPAGATVSVLYGYRFYFGKETELAHDQQNTFWLDGRELTFDIFRCKPELEFGENIWKFRDTLGNAVLAVYYSVPTFDFDDREWDSYGIYYIIQHNDHLCAIRKRGGYRLAKVSYFDNVYCADTTTVQFMETIGMIGRCLL